MPAWESELVEAGKSTVVHALDQFEKRAREISNRIDGRRSIRAIEKDELQVLYKDLKEEIKAAAKRGKVFQNSQTQTDWERYYFAPAVMKALNGLRARTNTNPISSNWIGSLLDASSEFSYYLSMIERDHPEDQ